METLSILFERPDQRRLVDQSEAPEWFRDLNLDQVVDSVTAERIGADLIIVGQHGHAGVLDRMLGSTSDRVVDTARCAVLVVPGETRHH